VSEVTEITLNSRYICRSPNPLTGRLCLATFWRKIRFFERIESNNVTRPGVHVKEPASNRRKDLGGMFC